MAADALLNFTGNVIIKRGSGSDGVTMPFFVTIGQAVAEICEFVVF